jgi:galactose mutarotase-like enzyme
MDLIEIAGPKLRAAINPLGAELTSLTANGAELMTDADPAFWTGHAPLLFPIVGRLADDMLRLDGQEFAMKQHGFARRQMFEPVIRKHDAVLFRLAANEETRAQYPFEFDLEIHYAIGNDALIVDVRIYNPSDHVALPASFGFHPAFAWPLPNGGERGAHHIVFAADEPGAIVQLDGGLFAGHRASPLDGRKLPLADDLFIDDALIWDPVLSQSVTYHDAHGPRLRVDFPETPQLGIWTKPGAAFICIEPWHGHADPAGFHDDFRAKPGVFEIAPKDDWACRMVVTAL